MRGSAIGLGLLLMLCIASAQAATGDVHAFLDRNQAQLGDTVTLNLQVDGASDIDTPDLSALGSDFDVLGNSRSTSISIVNGQRSEKTLWAVSLRPRHTGTLTIPSLQVNGKHTRALTLKVTAAPAVAEGGPGDDAFIQATVDTATPYVGQEVNLTVRLFYAPNLTDGNLDQPHADGIKIRPLSHHGTRYQVERGGRRYHVLEQHYALFARHAGRIIVPPLRFSGRALDADGFPSFFGGGRSVQARSAALSLQVRKQPTMAGKQTWLPAREVSLSLDGLPASGRIQVGEPLTLTLSEKATGLTDAALPQLELPPLDGVEVYPDQPETHTGDDGQWVQGQRSRKFAIVPQHAGMLTIPAINLHWWNVVSDREEVATLPQRTLTVVPSSAASSMAPATSVAMPVSAAGRGAAIVSMPAASRLWRKVALLSLALWLLSAVGLVVWWRYSLRARTKSVQHASMAAVDASRRPRNAFLHAVRTGDVAAQAAALLTWARSERPHLRNLGELKDMLASVEQRALVDALEQARYASAATAPEGDALTKAFTGGFEWKRPTASVSTALPPLYPH